MLERLVFVYMYIYISVHNFRTEKELHKLKIETYMDSGVPYDVGVIFFPVVDSVDWCRAHLFAEGDTAFT